MENFAFDPVNGFKDTASYPDPASGTAAREQLMSLHTQTQTFINTQLVAVVNSLQTVVNNLSGSLETDETNIGNLQTAVQNLQTAVGNLQTTTNGYATSFTTSGLKLLAENKTYAVTVVGGVLTATEVQ